MIKYLNNNMNQYITMNTNIERFDFQCKISENMIEYKCYKKEKEAHFDFHKIDQTLYKSWFVLLRESINALKTKGYLKVVQAVTNDDWERFLKDDEWKIKSTFTQNGITIHLIECNIDDAIYNIAKGLGALPDKKEG